MVVFKVKFLDELGLSSIGSSAAIFGVVIVLLLTFAVVGGGGNSQSDKSKIGHADTPTNINKDVSGDTSSIRISALGVKINNPENRSLIVETINPTTKQYTNLPTGFYIRDNNNDFFNRCNYPANIVLIDDSNSNQVLNDFSKQPYTKTINYKTYYVGAGYSDQKPCGSLKDADMNYQTELRSYIVSNLDAL